MSQPLINQFAIKKEPIDSFQFDSPEEKELNDQVNRDVEDMDKYANPARQIARSAIQGYMALTRPPDIGRSRFFVPKLHAITYSRMAMEAANLPTIEYKARNSKSEPKMQFINAAKDNAETGDGNLRSDSLNLWFHQNFDKILFGVGFRYLTYNLQTRIVKVRDEKGKVVEKKMIVHDDIWDEVPDFFHVGVSRDMQPGMFGGTACYMDKFFLKDAFMEKFDTPLYQNVKKAAIRDDWLESDGIAGNQWEVPEGYVRVRYYWNIYKDLFYVQANGVPIRNDFIQDYGPSERPKKFLPITSIHNDIAFDTNEPSFPNILQDGRQYADVTRNNTNKTFWSKSDTYLTKGLIGFSNSIWRAALDHTKASSVHFLLAQSSGIYDQIRTADLYGVVPIKNADKESFNVQSLTEGSRYLEQFTGMEEVVDNLMTWALGNDWRRASTELTNEKATVAAIKQQVQRIRMEQNQKFNESGGIKRHYRVLLNLIQQYYPEKTLKALGPDGVPEGTKEEDIVRDRDGHPVEIATPKEVPIDKDIVMLRKKDGSPRPEGKDHPDAEDRDSSRTFLAEKELIVTEEEPEIYIEPGSTFAELKALDRALLDERANRILQFLQVSYPNPETGLPEPLIPREGAEEFIREYSEAWDKDPDKYLRKDEGLSEQEKLDDEVPPPFAEALTQPLPELQQLPVSATPAPAQTGQQSTPSGIQGLAASITP